MNKKEYIAQVRREASYKRWGAGKRPKKKRVLQCDKVIADKLSDYCKRKKLATCSVVSELVSDFLKNT